MQRKLHNILIAAFFTFFISTNAFALVCPVNDSDAKPGIYDWNGAVPTGWYLEDHSSKSGSYQLLLVSFMSSDFSVKCTYLDEKQKTILQLVKYNVHPLSPETLKNGTCSSLTVPVKASDCIFDNNK